MNHKLAPIHVFNFVTDDFSHVDIYLYAKNNFVITAQKPRNKTFLMFSCKQTKSLVSKLNQFLNTPFDDLLKKYKK